MVLEAPFGPATIEDCYDIARLFKIASGGVAEYTWTTMQADYPGLSPIEIGERRYASDKTVFTYKNSIVASQDDQVMGVLVTFPIADEVDEPSETPDSMARIVPTIPLHFRRPWRSDGGGTTAGMQELEQRREQLPRTASGTAVEDRVLAPYSLEAPGSWYICAMALFPEFRGQGLGTKLLAIARSQAQDRGFNELSLLAFEQNTGAVRFYERNGFKTVDRTTVVPHELIQYTGDVLLMTAPV
ncbi:MAG: GNAT family N-acetyltransferase [Acidiferrobacterales bacterium]